MGSEGRWELQLAGGWQLRRDKLPVKVALRQRRLIAALALYGRQSRSFLAGLLWPDSSETQAAGSLRESIFLINKHLPGLLGQTADPLDLASGVIVDVHEVRARAARLQEHPVHHRGVLDLVQNAELLPGWYEDWVVSEQERWQRLRLTVLERLSRQYLDQGDTEQAMEAARAATVIEPLRESAQRLLMQACLAEGNHAEALRLYQSFRIRLRREFGVAPSAIISDLIEPLLMDDARSQRHFG
ncbi:AfsR/SARP family transcriptional regulator [Crystallibacter crystallopoietes]|nr:bacterial transcriptional activator domain-containing protein [Arthrobacter crystallopoietes]